MCVSDSSYNYTCKQSETTEINKSNEFRTTRSHVGLYESEHLGEKCN